MNNQSSPPSSAYEREDLITSKRIMWITLAGVLVAFVGVVVTAYVGWLAYIKDDGPSFQQTIKQIGAGNQAGLLNIKLGGSEAGEESKNTKTGKVQQVERPEFKPRRGGGPSWVF
jgi:hypothetical protein